MRSVALGLWVRTGSRNETPAQAGVSHFLEHLLFKGTERYSAIEISERFDGLGASVNAATGKETTHLHARFLDEHTEEVFDLLAEMLLGADLPGSRLRARGRARGDRDVRGRAAGPRPRHPRRGGLRRAPARPPGTRRGRGDRLDPGPRDRRVSPSSLRRRETSSSALRATSTTSRSSRWPSGWSPRARSRRRRRAAAVHARRDARLRFYEKDTEQYHICFGAPGHRSRRRAPLRARRARLDLRRLQLLAPLPRGAREARPRLRGRLLHRAVHRLRLGRRLRRHPRGQRRGGLRRHRRRARAPARRAGLRARSWPAPRRASRVASCSPRSRPRRAWRASRARPSSTCRSTASTRCWPRSTRSSVDDLTELATELYGTERLSAACVGREESRFREALAPVSESLVAA